MQEKARGGSSAGRLVGMNGLRGAAALSILASHVWEVGSPGGVTTDVGPLRFFFGLLALGVPLFFTLSGFLLYRRFAAAIIGVSAKPSIREYARARILRIVPAYWAILLLVGLVFSAALVRTPDSNHLELGNLAAHPGALAADLALAQNYVPSTTVTGIGPTWTLAIEAVFYVVLPLLALPVIALANRGRSLRLRFALALAPPATLLLLGLATQEAARVLPSLSAGDGWNADWPTVLQRSFLFHADLFAAGMSAAAVTVLLERGHLRIGTRARTAGLAVAALLFVSVALLDYHGAYPDVLYAVTMSACFAALLLGLATAGEGGSRLAAFFQWRPLALVGTISYSVFLWHEPVVRWLSDHQLTEAGRFGLALNTLIVAAISLALAGVTYRLIERPFMARRRRPNPSRDPRSNDDRTGAQVVTAPATRPHELVEGAPATAVIIP